MIFWPSGISSPRELLLAKQAGTTRLLVSCFNLEQPWFTQGWKRDLWIDSDAYPFHKRGQELSLKTYFLMAKCYKHTWITAPDRIGDPIATANRLAQAQEQGLANLVPVWPWRSNWEHHIDDIWELLEAYPVVGIGGCVQWLRQEHSEAKTQEIERLAKLCETFPNQFHLFGLHDVQAFNRLKDSLYSADSSTWVSKAGKRVAIFVHATHGGLRRVPVAEVAHYLGLSPDISNDDLAIYNLKTLLSYCQ